MEPVDNRPQQPLTAGQKSHHNSSNASAQYYQLGATRSVWNYQTNVPTLPRWDDDGRHSHINTGGSFTQQFPNANNRNSKYSPNAESTPSPRKRLLPVAKAPPPQKRQKLGNIPRGDHATISPLPSGVTHQIVTMQQSLRKSDVPGPGDTTMVPFQNAGDRERPSAPDRMGSQSYGQQKMTMHPVAPHAIGCQPCEQQKTTNQPFGLPSAMATMTKQPPVRVDWTRLVHSMAKSQLSKQLLIEYQKKLPQTRQTSTRQTR